jgi:zinc protease
MRMINIFICVLLISLSPFASANSFKTEKWVTKNGVPVVFYKAMEVPMLDVSIAFAAGSAYDGNQFGLSSFLTHMINQGNAGKDATAIAEALADTGSQFDTESNRDMVIFNLRTLTSKEALDRSTTIFNQIINHPDFPNEAFESERKQLLMTIEQSDESPDDVANLNLFKVLYKNHPYAHSVNGTTSTIKAINKSQLIDFYKKYYVAHNAVVVIVGAVDSPKAHQIAEQLTQDLAKGSPAASIPRAKQLTKSEKINIQFPSSQTIIRLGQIGIDHQEPNYFPLMVGNYILGGGALTSRLATEIREKRGLTYGINSQFTPMPGNGPFLITLSTKNDQAQKALKIIEDTLRLFIANGPDKQELEAAKKFLTGSYPLSLSSNRAIATVLVRMAFYHLPDSYLDTYVDKINAVTVDEIKRAFKQQVDPDKLLLITVGRS